MKRKYVAPVGREPTELVSTGSYTRVLEGSMDGVRCLSIEPGESPPVHY
jgi:hypothetical protein